MPAHRAGGSALYSLKTVCVFPDNPQRGLDAHQGTVTLFDGETGEVQALMNASAITAIRTAAVSAVATRLLAREDARELGVLGAGVQARSHLEALRLVRDFDRVRIYSPTAEHAAALADEAGAEAVGSAEECVRGADVVVAATSSLEPVLEREWLKEGAHVNSVGGRPPLMRELDAATIAASSFFVDRRESSGSRGRRLPRGARSGRDRLRPHQGGDRRGADRRLARPHGARRADGLSFSWPRCRGSRRRRVRRPPGPRDRRRRRGRVLIPLEEIRRAQETIAGTAVRTPLVSLHASNGPAELYLKLENLQPIGSFKLRGAYNAAPAREH